MKIEIEQEVDGRWIAEIPDLPGVICYGKTRDEAVANAKALALRVMADRLVAMGGTEKDLEPIPRRKGASLT